MMFPTISSQTYQTGGQLSIDLHGSSVRKAKTSLQVTFDTAEERGHSQVTFITGVGKHSKNNYSVLFNKTVPEFLEQPEIKARISQVKRDRRGAYEVVFKNKDELEKIEMLKKSWAPFFFPDHDFERVKQKAEKGSTDDQFNLGIRYLQGYGTEINVEEAERWMISAANNGYHYANTQLGLMYDLGYGVKQNYRKALRRHEKAAENGAAYSLLTLGGYYWLGKIVVRDDLKAVDYLSRAAKLNEHSAACNLGVILLGGTETVSTDPLQAKQLFESAAKANFVWGQVLLAKQHFLGWGIPQNDLEAHKWFQIASKKNDLMAQYYLGRIYNEGRGVPKNQTLAFKWFQKSAAQGDKDAKTSVARFLIEGTIVPQNIAKGIDDLKDLAEKGHPQSAGTLGCYYLNGIKGKLKKNLPLAIKYLSQAAEDGDVSSLKLLASLHFKGEIEDANPNTGERFLRKATKKNDPVAPFMLAEHLLKKGAAECVEIVQLFEQKVTESDNINLQFITIPHFLKLNRFAEAKVLLDRSSPEMYKTAEEDPKFAYEIGRFYQYINETISAMNWFSKASDQNHRKATIELFRLLHMRVQTNPTTDPTIFKKPFEKGLQVANFGDLSAQYMIACVYLEGAWGIEQNNQEAAYWFQKAAESGDVDSQILLDQLQAMNENKNENALAEESFSEAENEPDSRLYDSHEPEAGCILQ